MRAILFPTRTIILTLIAALCLGGVAPAQQSAPQRPLEGQSTVPQQVSPGPLQPQPTEQPREGEQLPNAPQPPATQGTTQPLGAAAAGKAETAGGAASRPAGTAIAPAKQRQVRSFLLKMGLIAAGGVAIGTAYALSKSSPSRPPSATQ